MRQLHGDATAVASAFDPPSSQMIRLTISSALPRQACVGLEDAFNLGRTTHRPVRRVSGSRCWLLSAQSRTGRIRRHLVIMSSCSTIARRAYHHLFSVQSYDVQGIPFYHISRVERGRCDMGGTGRIQNGMAVGVKLEGSDASEHFLIREYS